ncbi:MAG: hypothetical protein Q7U13_11615, partial [Rhodoferax sp.]|nr:hypothetical protein [Rhodoferax sp.]
MPAIRVRLNPNVERPLLADTGPSPGKPSIDTTPRSPEGARLARQRFTRSRAMPTTQHQHIATVMQVATDGADAQAAAGHEQVIRDSWLRCVQQHRLDPTRMQEAVILPQARLREHQDQMEA